MSGGEIRYRRPGGVEPGRADRPVLSTGRGGFCMLNPSTILAEARRASMVCVRLWYSVLHAR